MEIEQHTTEEQLGQRRGKQIKRCTDMNDNNSTIYQNFWDMAKAVIRGKFISLQAQLQK